MRFQTLALVLAAGLLAADASAQRNVILYIGDGYGVGPKSATRMALGQGQPGSRFSTDSDFQLLATDRMRYAATVTTHSANSWVTDSAPGAFVYAAGQAGKIDNDVISFDLASGESIESILEAAKREGYMVGLVSSARITHATPAVFASHIWSRSYEDYIAAQYVSETQAEYEAVFDSPIAGISGPDFAYDAERDWVLPEPKRGVRLDVLMGGGARHFLPSGRGACAAASDLDPHGNAVVRDQNGAPVLDGDGAEISFSGRRNDCVDLIKVAQDRGFTYVNSRDAVLGLDGTAIDALLAADPRASLLGLFESSHATYELERQLTAPYYPSLEEMTRAAITFLEAKSEAAGNDKGFFLMVEGARIDHLEHANAGGIAAQAGGEYEIIANEEAIVADAIYGSGDPAWTPLTVDGYYGSDYMIREVLAFDYAVAAGLEFMRDASRGETLVMQSSDHECGGFTAVGLNSAADAADTGIRTYAPRPAKANGQNNANPETVQAGGSWFPEYTMETFQGREYPRAPESGRRIVISYGSNPFVNGNSTNAGVTPGNHTPADIRAAADDNVGGTYAGRLVGRGLLDNTDLYPIMSDFLGVSISTGGTFTSGGPEAGALGLTLAGANPSRGGLAVDLRLDATGPVTVDVLNTLGRRVATLHEGPLHAGAHALTADLDLASGVYVVRAQAAGEVVSQKVTVVR